MSPIFGKSSQNSWQAKKSALKINLKSNPVLKPENTHNKPYSETDHLD
jgi:hypothetical protein